MKPVKGTRKFDGKKYTLVSNPYGDNSKNANMIKEKYISNGDSARIIVNTSQPYIYPEGRYFVYVRSNKK